METTVFTVGVRRTDKHYNTSVPPPCPWTYLGELLPLGTLLEVPRDLSGCRAHRFQPTDDPVAPGAELQRESGWYDYTGPADQNTSPEILTSKCPHRQRFRRNGAGSLVEWGQKFPHNVQ